METIQMQLGRLTNRRSGLDILPRTDFLSLRRGRYEVHVEGTQAQIDQLIETARVKGYQVGVQPNLMDPSLWKLDFTNIDQVRLRDELPQDVMEAGLTVLGQFRWRPTAAI